MPLSVVRLASLRAALLVALGVALALVPRPIALAQEGPPAQAEATPAVAPPQGLGDLDVLAAMDALTAGDDRRALSLLESYLRLPRDPEARAEVRLLAARAALSLGEGQRALDLLVRLEGVLPEVADLVLAYRGRAYRSLGLWADALACWQELLAKYGDSPYVAEARYGAADAYFAADRLAEAKTAYEEAMKVHRTSPREPGARFNLAVIAERERRWVDAAAGYRYIAFYRLDDPASDLARQRFDVLVAQGHASPPNVWQLLAQVDLLLSSRSLEEAESALQQVRALATSGGMRAAVRYRDAKLLYRRRDFEGAATIFTALAKESSGRDRTEYEMWLARTYSTAGQYEQAIKTYLEVASREAKGRDGREALFKAAWLGYNAGQHRTALKHFGEYIDLYRRDSQADEALWYMAWNAYRLGDLPSAVATLERLRDEFPVSSLAQRTYYWEGRFQLAMNALEPARRAFARTRDMEPLSYYGVLATARLEQLQRDLSPVKTASGTYALASLGDGPVAPLTTEGAPGSLEPAADELPPETRPRLPADKLDLPWGQSVFDWESALGKRALRLIKLSLAADAADVVARLPALPGYPAAEVTYARARLLYGLEDYHAAYRLAATAFGDQVRTWPAQGERAAAGKGVERRYVHLAYPDAYGSVVTAAAAEFKLSPYFILAVMRQESAFDDRARSWASAHGLMQIIPVTGHRIAEALGVPQFEAGLLRQPSVSVRFGSWYLGQLVAKFQGNLPLAIAAYNAGPQAVSSWAKQGAGRPLDEFVEEIPFRETRHYVKHVLGNYAVYLALYEGQRLQLPETVSGSYLDNIDF